MSSVLRCLGEDMEKDPTSGPMGTRREPWRRGKRLRVIKRVEPRDDGSGPRCDLFVAIEKRRQGLIRQHLEACGVCFLRSIVEASDRVRTVDDEAHPAIFHAAHVLDDPAQAQLARRRLKPRLLIGEALDRVSEECSVLFERRKYVVALTAHDALLDLGCPASREATNPARHSVLGSGSVPAISVPIKVLTTRTSGSRHRADGPAEKSSHRTEPGLRWEDASRSASEVVACGRQPWRAT